MIPHELPPKVTPLTYQSVINSMLLVWEQTGTQPNRAAVRLATAQIAIESGMRACMNYCISGIKSKPNNGVRCWQYFQTSEFWTADEYEHQAALGPNLIEATDKYDGNRRKYLVHPKHPACCFRAFETLDDAMLDHLLYLQHNYPEAWDALLKGYAIWFAHGLRQRGYFTAPERDYLAGERFRLAEEIAAVDEASLVWGDVAEYA